MVNKSTGLASDSGITIAAGCLTGVGGDVGRRCKSGQGGEVGGRGGVCGEGTRRGTDDAGSKTRGGDVKSTGSKFKTRCKVDGIANGEFEMYTGQLYT